MMKWKINKKEAEMIFFRQKMLTTVNLPSLSTKYINQDRKAS